MAAAASTFANPHAEPDFKLSPAIIDELNDNGFVRIFPHFGVFTPEGAAEPIYEPNTERPNTIIFMKKEEQGYGYSEKKPATGDKMKDCLQYVKIERTSVFKRIEKLTFVQCDNKKVLATVDIDRNMLGEANEIEIEMEPNRKETITLGHTLFGNRLKKLKVVRDWRQENKTTEVKVDRSIWSSKVETKESQISLS
ncbi:hypothetical protein SYNPS1DRAFT_27838 [Syncephalis pseudoplumigaleata]|uniref:Uncharacterized protein n=1 Tax=Syncephalis pseudoplumigaleata TaxID=1712513 RepID=A0A4P9Z1X7_9FUNG|nr:hypothetical protein SYNPS1DRAFT_27838 [Syncephalis pseudoplumigaleata]|eukprot:RKP26464.1 hypothetical protein SYNPS1DRAFT_27838 [Syncephalis pseudoplumigaleata]